MNKYLKILIFVSTIFAAFFSVTNHKVDNNVYAQSCGCCSSTCCGIPGCYWDGNVCIQDCNMCGCDPPVSTPTPTPTPTSIPTPTPTLRPCAPYLESPTYECNDNETAKVNWKWTPIPISNPAQIYLLQVAFDGNFNNLDEETLLLSPNSALPGKLIGAINYFTNFSVNNPSTLRFSRVRVLQSSTACETGGEWEWSNITTTAESCVNEDSIPEPPPIISILNSFFCDNEGNPTSDPGSGMVASAVGCIPVTDVQSFVTFTTQWSIGIAGGIAFLLIAYSGFLYLGSGGNPQKVQSAKELITAAVGGILFLIFSATILRLTSSNILNIINVDLSPVSCSTQPTVSASVSCSSGDPVINFYWSAVDDHTSYELQYDNSGNCTLVNGVPECSFDNATTVIVNTNSYTLNPAQNSNAPHYYRVKPFVCNDSVWSQIKTTVPFNCN